MKKIIILILGLAMFIISCGGGSPKSKLESIMGNIQKGNLEEISEVSSNVKIDEIIPLKEGFSKITYKINSEQVNENQAVINITVKTPDMSPFLQEYMGKLFPLIMNELKSGKSQEEIIKSPELKKVAEEFFKEKFKSDQLKYTEKTMDVNLKKENGKWELEKGKNDEFILTVTTFGITNILNEIGK